MSKKALFIVNPHSGRGYIKNHLLEIIDTLNKVDYEVTVHITQRRGEAIEVSKNRDSSYELLVCSGGDGTLDEVVTGMIQSGFKTTIGYIPAGSTNDFANSLDLPSSMNEAAQIVAEGNTFPCDVGLFNDDVFIYVAAFGLFTEVSYETPQDLKNVLGHAAYLLEGMKSLSNVDSYKVKVTTDDRVIEDEFIYGMISNSFSVGGFKNITRRNKVELNDGLFEVTLIKRPNNVIELNSILAALVSEKIDTDYMYSFTTSKLVIESEDEIPWTLDGEFGGSHSRVELANAKEAMDIIVRE